jgi:hypothetical protein
MEEGANIRDKDMLREDAMRFALLVLAGLSLFNTAAAAAVPDAGPAAFLRKLYAHYVVAPSVPGPPVFDPLDAAAGRWFSPLLLTLIRRHEAVAGRLGGDPVCDCQDYQGFVLQSVVVRPARTGMAVARVRFVNEGRERILRVSLIKRQDGWRINDVGDVDTPSLRLLLTAPE